MHLHAVPSMHGRAATIDSVGREVYNQKESSNTDPTTLGAAYQLFRRQEHVLETCQGQRQWECPVCAKYMHSGHADGNMKIWTRKNDNKISRASRYEGDQGAIFVADRHVEGVLVLIQQACGKGHKETPQDKLCGRSQFVAAGDRAGRAAGKDISGRFITSCSHQLVVRMLNMPSKHGRERYAYAYIMAAELSKLGAQVFFGDLACKWYPWMQGVVDKLAALLQNKPGADANLPQHLVLSRQQLDSMVPAISVMHS